ncbi:hypothetical protein [Serratia marcescens]|uniref:hypothetical protein n=1 Tax=Serratia marcescens TaxID=615 RepID=UPI001F1537F5|nr:hypothetical protein [Serratia marcescens]
MKDKIVFINDQERVRNLYGSRLQRLFGDIVDVVALEPKSTTEDMLSELISIKNIVAYIIDENLTYSGKANYQGVGLIKRIREIDQKIPIYILTSNTSLVDVKLGDIEFVIDKVDFSQEENKNKFLQRFLRHLSTYKDIKTQQAKRFDELLIKSLDNPLSEEEKDEFNGLNAIRSKTLIDEGCISEKDLESLQEQNKKLSEIENKLKELLDE